MLVTILRDFSYAQDGIHSRDLVAGTVEDILDDLVPGLVAEGWVSAGVSAPASEPVTPPAPEPETVDPEPVEEAPEPALVNLDDDSLGLTLREIHADLTALSVEFDPAADHAALLALRGEARAKRDTQPTDAYPHLSPAQETALDLDGDKKPGGSKARRKG